MMSRAFRLPLLAICAAFMLAACGFHLPAPADLPPQMDHVRIDTLNPDSTLARRLSLLLEQSGRSVVMRGPADSILALSLDRVRKEVLTIGDNARVREYRLRHTVTFSLVDPEGAVLVPEQTLEQTRVISFDESDILGAAQEDEQLRREMADTLARLVLRRLGTPMAGG